MGRLLIYISLIAVFFLSACASRPQTSMALEEALHKNIAISIPMRVTEKGLIVLEDVKIDGSTLNFVLDTGATQSAIFETPLQQLGLELTSNSETMVHGMMQSKQRRIVKIPKLELGPIQFLAKSLIVLDDRASNFEQENKYDGLIGMDILSNYQLYFSPQSNVLRFIPNKFDVFVPTYWERVQLLENPFVKDNRSLHFIEIRVDGRNTAALIDTGAEFSAMNWEAASFVQSKRIRKRLRKTWKLQGAVGTFEPVAKVIMDRLRSGQKFWKDKNFIIMDFKSLDVLGVDDEPFIIVGMNLLAEETIFIDFKRNVLTIKPVGRDIQTQFAR